MGSILQTYSTGDIPGLLRLSREAGWDHTSRDWQAILETGRVIGHRGPDETILSCGALFEYDTLASLGMMLVTAGRRGQGLGSEILSHLLAGRGSPQMPVMLVAGVGVDNFYSRRGFMKVEEVLKLRANSPPPELESGYAERFTAAPLDPGDLPRVAALDRQVFGGDRSRLLTIRYDQARRAVWLRDRDRGTLMGYGMGIMQDAQLAIGPLVGFNRFAAIELIAHLSAGHSGPVRLDIPSRRRDLADTLSESGFQIEAVQSVMAMGMDTLPGRRDHLFALASQAWG